MQLSISIIQNSERLHVFEMFLKSQKFVVVILLLYKILADADDVANERIQKLERELAEVKCENNQLRDVCCEFGYKASLAEVMILEDFKFILRKNFRVSLKPHQMDRINGLNSILKMRVLHLHFT